MTNNDPRHATPARSRRLAARAIVVLVMVAALAACSDNSKTATKRDPAELDTQYQIKQAQNLAVQASKAKDPEKAIELYQKSVQAYAQLPAVWNNLGVLLMEASRRQEADQAFATASELATADPRPLFNRGLLRFDAKRPDEARTFFTQSLARDPNYLPALRGAIESDITLRRIDEETLELLNRAMFLEQDERWRDRMELQRARVESALEDAADAAAAASDRRMPVTPAVPRRRSLRQ